MTVRANHSVRVVMTLSLLWPAQAFILGDRNSRSLAMSQSQWPSFAPSIANA